MSRRPDLAAVRAIVRFRNHEFHYEPHTDLFRCILCQAYEMVAYAGEDPDPCPGEPPAGSGPIEVNAW